MAFEKNLEQVPDQWDQSHFPAESKRAQAIKDNPESMLPALPNWGEPRPELRDYLTSVLMGLGRSTKASMDAAQLGDPVLASLAALGASAGGPGPDAFAAQRAEQQRAAMLQQLSALPVDKVAPQLVKQHPEFSGLPLAVIEKLGPYIQRNETLRQQAELFRQAEEGRNARAEEAINAAKDKALEPKPISAEASIKVTLAQDAKRNMADIRAILAKPNARDLILKGGGSYKGLSRLATAGDADAEILANAIFQVADAEARIKTGAAINKEEVEDYFNKLVPKTGTLTGTLDRLNRKQSYFDSVEGGLTYGKRVAPAAGGSSAHAGGEIRKQVSTANGIKTGVWDSKGKFLRYE